ncbi:Metal reductase [subsurface metagenome]
MKVLTNTKLIEIVEEGATVTSNGDKRILKADSVVLALGLKPEAALSEELRDRVSELYTIGDCVEPRRLINAIWEAYRIARLI